MEYDAVVSLRRSLLPADDDAVETQCFNDAFLPLVAWLHITHLVPISACFP